MADNDDSEKTEDPTGKRVTDARRKGNIAQSQEVKSLAVLAGIAFSLVTFLPWMMGKVTFINYKFLEQPHAFALDPATLQTLFLNTVSDVALITVPILFFFTALSFIASFAQVGRTFSWEKIKPDVSKLNILKGFKKLFGVRAVTEFAKGLVKLVIVAVVSVFVASPLLSDVALFPAFEVITSLKRIEEIAVLMVLWTVAIMIVLSVLDYLYQVYETKKGLKMSKQEVKDEHKQLEGDPKVKARLASIRQERSRQRMIAAVHKADVVITNPTHYAVALQYDMDIMPAPKLIAKGIDDVAMRIREEAETHEVAIVENPPLARALYAAVELDQEIPAEHYHAVAEVIGYVFRLKGRLPGEGPLRPPPPDWSIDPGDPDDENTTPSVDPSLRDPSLH